MTEQLEVLEVDDIEVFEVLNNPMRMSILSQMIDPISVRDVAATLDVPVTRLYYHVNLLESVGVIRIVETRKVGAMLQKIYQTTAKSIRPSLNLAESGRPPVEMARIGAAVVLDPARVDAEAALATHFQEVADGVPEEEGLHGALGRTIGYFSPDDVEKFESKLMDLLGEFFDASKPDDYVEYAFSYTFFPIAGPTGGKSE